MDGAAEYAPDLLGHGSADWLADQAVAALHAELDLTPKPGLVDLRGAGAHWDMSHALMQASAQALRPGFQAIAVASVGAGSLHSARRALRAELGALGRASEVRMLRATGGVNTHRGAIWTLGLLVAAGAACPRARSPETLLDWVAMMAAIDDPAMPPARVPENPSNGQRAVARFGVAGARGEAMAGFPQIIDVGMPTLRVERRRGAGPRVARLNTLLALMAVLDDTCVLSRAGAAGLAMAQDRAADIVAAGGVATRSGAQALAALDAALLAHNASPGGSADLLAATLFADALESASDYRSSVAHGLISPFAEEPRHANLVA